MTFNVRGKRVGARKKRYVEDMAWREEAACRDMDKAIFFPDAREPDSIQRALDVCETCDVVPECGKYGEFELYGVWGGEYRQGRWDG